MKSHLLKLASVAFLFTACTSNQVETEQVAPISHEESAQNESNSLELNNGEKWKINTEMIAHIQQMKVDIETFSSTNDSDYKALAGKLKANIKLLISSCTMDGKAHDELHKWLLPFIGLINDFADAKDTTISLNKFQEIKKSFAQFELYFQ